VRHAIVHNEWVVRSFESRGVIFVEEISEIPSGSTVVFSAHGVSPAVVNQAQQRSHEVIDATCPLVTKVHRDKVASYVDAGEAAGATIVVDGRNPEVDGEPGGYWLGPTLIDNVTTEMSVYTDEIFGPVLSVLRVNSYDEALDMVNVHPYGNGTAIFTNDGGAARRFQNEVEVGMIGINVPIPVPMAYYSFGGWKNSLFGDSHAHGTEGVHFFTRGKVVTSRWLDPSHGGINLGFPQNV